MKILQINKYHYIKGGSDTVFFNTIKLLEENGHEVIPFCLKNKKNLPAPLYEKYFVDYPEMSESNIWQKLRNFISFFYNKDAKRKIEKLIMENKPDIAHIHLLFNGISVSILPVLRKHNIPVIMTLHDYRLICPAYTLTDSKNQICEKCKKKKYYNCLLNNCSYGGRGIFVSLILVLDILFRNLFYNPSKYIDKFIFVSKFSRNKHIEFSFQGEKKSLQLYNFFLKDITLPQCNISEKYEKGYFLFYGRISAEKGIQTLMEAAKKLPSIEFIIVGKGPLSLELKKLPNIKYLGYKTGVDLLNIIQKAKFVLVPSEWYENNPMTIIESLSLNTPIIGSNIGGIPELLDNEKNGFLFNMKDPADLAKKIQMANNMDFEAYNEITKRASNFARINFHKDSHYCQLINLYSKLLK